MRLRIFRAPTTAEAMARIRAELGLDALILSTERHAGQVEVTVALEPEDEEPPPLEFLPSAGEPAWPDLWTDEPEPSHEAPVRFAPQVQAPDAPEGSLAWHGAPKRLLEARQEQPVEAACAALFRFAPLPLGPGEVLLLAGPPGAGKTLGIAKLATRLVMSGQTPLVISADDRRAGGVEQLASFTRLLGLTLVAAGRPETLGRALARGVGGGPVLVDMPGLDLTDPDDLALFHDFLVAARRQGAQPHVALVLPAGLDRAEAEETAILHAAQGTRLLMAARIDRQRRLGGLLSAAMAGDLALTEAGVGAHVADSLVSFTPGMLAERLTAHPATRPATRPALQSPALDTQARHAPASHPHAWAASAPAMAEPPPPQDPARHPLALHIAAQKRGRAQPWNPNA